MTVRGVSRLILQSALFIVLGLMNQGCVNAKINEYETFTQDLGGKNELRISTYPSGFPRQISSVPFFYKELHTPDSVYFKVFIREAGKRGGRNPNIESILIHSFSYEFPAQEPVELISDFPENFWMQGDSKYSPGGSSPVPYNDHWYLKLKINLTVNGQHYSFEETVHAKPRRRFIPLILHALR